MGRLRWFLAGAAAAAGALVARPEAYRRVRSVLDPSSEPRRLPPGEHRGGPPPPPRPEPSHAAGPAPPPPPPMPPPTDPAQTNAMREKIDQTRARIAEKAGARTDGEPAPLPPEADPEI